MKLHGRVFDVHRHGSETHVIIRLDRWQEQVLKDLENGAEVDLEFEAPEKKGSSDDS